MAIDNPEERRSVAGISTGQGVTPNAAKDAEWRAQVGQGFSGIPADEAATGGSNYTTPVQSPMLSPTFSPMNPPISLGLSK